MGKKKKFIGISDEHIHNDGTVGHDYHTPAGKEHLPSDLVEHIQKKGKMNKRDRF